MIVKWLSKKASAKIAFTSACFGRVAELIHLEEKNVKR